MFNRVWLRDLAIRVLTRWVSPGLSEMRARQQLRQLSGVLRFSALFTATVLVPAVMLSFFALSSIRTEDLAMDQDLTERAEMAAQGVRQQLSAGFSEFENAALRRIASGESLTLALADLSPHLRGAYRFSSDGSLAEPFRLPAEVEEHPQTRAYRRAFWEARALESNDPAAAIEAWNRVAELSPTPDQRGYALFNGVRATWNAGLRDEAEPQLDELLSEYANRVDPYGHRLGSLIRLRRAEYLLLRDPEAGTEALQQLVNDLLERQWTLQHGGEPAVIRRALATLEGRAQGPWLARARTRLRTLSDQRFWAEAHLDALETLPTLGMRVSGSSNFGYFSDSEEDVLWSVWRGEQGQTFAFSFQLSGVIDELRAARARADALDAGISTRLVPSSTAARSGPHTLTVLDLDPWVPLEVVVDVADPEVLAATKRQRSNSRVFWVGFAVLWAVFGILVSARLVGRELESARLRADFAANVSHELRSPITQIRLKAEALQLDLCFDDEDRQAHYDAIVRESERLSRLVDNVLDFASIERGAKRYTLRPDDISAAVRSVVEAHRAVIEKRGLELECDVPDDLPVVWIDREAIGQVVTNLMSNAAKYGQEGGWVGVRARVGLDGVDISVADRGMGISPEDHERIFENFYRVHDTQVRAQRGTGIGLSIVRYIADAHGGSISVDSAVGRGSTFTLTIPLEPPEGAGA